MSLDVRFAQPVSDCQAGFAMYALQPPPLALHTVSDQPRALPSRASDVPPTATTCDEDAGHCAAASALCALHPPPLALHTVSDQPRALPSRASDEPPTAITCDEDAGHCAAAPASPAPKTNGTPIA